MTEKCMAFRAEQKEKGDSRGGALSLLAELLWRDCLGL